MKRKRLTQVFPFLIPIRQWQRNLFYQIKLRLDKNKYAQEIGEKLPFLVANEKSVMINEESGYDLIYQKNKVDNLKIASCTMNKILIYPGEVFSFCYLLNKSKKYGKYKEGLILINGKICPKVGGGICHLSNLLYYTFLHTPLTVIERHGHKIKSFPNPDKDSLEGVDATISSGWLDLKLRNDTMNVYQIVIEFDDEYMYVKILSDKKCDREVAIINDNFKYVRKGEKIFESTEVIRIIKDKVSKKELRREKLYDEVVEVGYELANNIKIWEDDYEKN